MKIGIIVQARTGSSRLSKKILLPFINGLSILDVILNRIKVLRYPVILATTINKNDDEIELKGNEHNVNVYRGSEEDVLNRFICAAKIYNIDVILRICSDNPFIQIDGIVELINTYLLNKSKNPDYVGYLFSDNRQSIKTHFGFYGELVTLEALERVSQIANKSIYHEHVTNYIYTFPNTFSIINLNAPKRIFSREDIRLTVDSPEDFRIVQKVYSEINDNQNINCIIDYLDDNVTILKAMQLQLQNNIK